MCVFVTRCTLLCSDTHKVYCSLSLSLLGMGTSLSKPDKKDEKDMAERAVQEC